MGSRLHIHGVSSYQEKRNCLDKQYIVGLHTKYKKNLEFSSD